MSTHAQTFPNLAATQELSEADIDAVVTICGEFDVLTAKLTQGIITHEDYRILYDLTRLEVLAPPSPSDPEALAAIDRGLSALNRIARQKIVGAWSFSPLPED